MKSFKQRITFKVLIGYVILGVLATISGSLVLSEIRTFTELQHQDLSDRNKIVKVGSLIADIYKNESLARAAIELNSTKQFDEYVQENGALLLKIDSLKSFSNNTSQEIILDSVKLFINEKLKNITDLKNLKLNDNSTASLETAINKLSSIDSLLGKVTISDLVENPRQLNKETREKFEEYVKILNKYNPVDSIGNIGQKQIDSLISISKNMLREAQQDVNKQRASLQKKEQELIENDLVISRKLRELLNDLETDILVYTHSINTQREKTLDQSKNIIRYAAAISFIIIIIFSLIILSDFWKTQRYRKQLEQANKITSSLLKSREHIISMVSHDLRTPLSTITGYGELLQKSVHGTKEANYLEHIRNASAYMGHLVDDLLEFSKLENNDIRIESMPFDLEKLINEIVINGKNIIRDKPIKFVVNHNNTTNQMIVSDPFRMKQILNNLITNACKFTNEGTITIESTIKHEGDKNTLQISVSDTGIGISKAQQKHIFKAFVQGDNNKEHTQNGFGLGLTISKKLAELLGGTLTLESELNKGSTFVLNIPITISNTYVITHHTSSLEKTYNLKALIVEDDASVQLLLSDLLKRYGIESHVYGNAQNALDASASIDYDFVLTDIQLPKMNGIHFMELLKKQSSYNNQPIIAMTGRSNLSVKDYINNGFSEVLIKPFNTKKLELILKKLFGLSVIKHNNETLNKEEKKEIGFSIVSLGSFFNHEAEPIKRTLKVFLEDTKNNMVLLQEAKKSHDTKTINGISHKMLSMFKQLEVEAVVPYLETLETSTTIDETLFIDLEIALNTFTKSLEVYLN
jgi:signal transduction histidine kinase/DNA-binding NarL/FixJ family response regulator